MRVKIWKTWGTDGKGREGHRELAIDIRFCLFFVPQLTANTNKLLPPYVVFSF